MVKPSGGGKLPHELSLADFRRKLVRFGWTVEPTRRGEYKAVRIAGDEEQVFGFATVSGRRVKRIYLRRAINYLGVSRDEFMKA